MLSTVIANIIRGLRRSRLCYSIRVAGNRYANFHGIVYIHYAQVRYSTNLNN